MQLFIHNLQTFFQLFIHITQHFEKKTFYYEMLHNMYEKLHNGWKVKTHDDIIWKKSGTMDEELKKKLQLPQLPNATFAHFH